MKVSFQGFQEQVLTFETDAADLAAGVPVKISANGKVAACGDGEYPAGVTVSAPRGGLVAVQVGGYVRLKYSGAAPALGGAAICGAAGGTIKSTTPVVKETGALAGRTVLVVDQDTAGTTAGVIL